MRGASWGSVAIWHRPFSKSRTRTPDFAMGGSGALACSWVSRSGQHGGVRPFPCDATSPLNSSPRYHIFYLNTDPPCARQLLNVCLHETFSRARCGRCASRSQSLQCCPIESLGATIFGALRTHTASCIVKSGQSAPSWGMHISWCARQFRGPVTLLTASRPQESRRGLLTHFAGD